MMMKCNLALAIAFAVLLTAHAASSDQSCAGGITVQGSGTVDAVPNEGTVLLQVTAKKPTAAAARDAAANATAAVIGAVGAINGIDRTSGVITSGISLSEEWQYNNGLRDTKPVGYQFSQQIRVSVPNLTNDLLAAVIDAAVTAGGDSLSINSVSADFTPDLKQKFLSQAQDQAVKNAQATANVLAKSAGVPLGTLTCMSSVDTFPMPWPYMTASSDAAVPGAAGASARTPINVGTSTVTATVTVTYLIGNGTTAGRR